METILEIKQVSKTYHSANNILTVLDQIDLTIAKGETLAITGPSGSGKTTLLGLCAGLDSASTGSVTLSGITLNQLNEDERAAIRNQYVGFIFQNFQLLPTLTALENVMVPLELRGAKNSKAIALELLEKSGFRESFAPLSDSIIRRRTATRITCEGIF
ncbi:MAG TPA: ATP-binding cassette domain-containing protein [Pedobacter sp.]|nr:ATP-binding cassette domain-containing protein [Pedobacter sp.]